MANDKHTLKRSQRNNASILTAQERQEVAERSRKRAVKAVEDREHLRLEIEARTILARMGATVNTFIKGAEEVTTSTGEKIEQPLSRERIQALKAAADIDKILLDRVLPPLKPMEIKQEDTELPDPSQLSDNELRRTLAKYLGLESSLPWIDEAEGTLQ